MSVAVPAWTSLNTLRLLRNALLVIGFVLLVALGVDRLTGGDIRGLGFVAAGGAGLAFFTRRGLPTAIWLGVALDGVLGFLGDSSFRSSELVAGLVGAAVAVAPVGTVEAPALTTDVGADAEGEPPLPEGPPARLRLRTIGSFQVSGPDGDLSAALAHRPVQEFLWLYLLARKLADEGPISRASLAEELSPRIDSDEQGNRLRRRLSDMQRDLPAPLLECLVLEGRQVDFNLDGCAVDVLRLADLRNRLHASGEIPPPTLVKEAEAALEVIGFGKFLPGWEEIEKRMTGAKGSAGDTIIEVRVSVSEDRAAIVLGLTGLYRAAGNPSRAIPLLIEVLEDNPELEDVARALVAAYLATGQSARAKEAQRKYLAQEDE
ncbi:MAG TPA: hypothetical protein VMU89_03845 [Thermomicrobiaceae bacterium]|nr:hypothetical protein [Thermomicrobiaceae bacterium]